MYGAVKCFFVVLMWWCAPAFAGDVNITPGVITDFKNATLAINAQLVAPALITASAALTLQWIGSHWRDVFNGDISNTLMKSVGVISWYGFSVFLINHQSEFGSYFDKYTALAGSLSNLSGAQFSPGYLINNAVTMIKATNAAFSNASNTHWWQVSDNLFGAIMLAFANVFTFVAFLIIALSVFVAQLEFWVMFSVAPLAFGLIPLSAFRDQGIAPIKGLMSLGLRIIILGVVVSIANKMTQNLINLLVNPGLQGGDSVFDPVWFYLGGMAACAMMAFSAGKIASSIASGSASFSGADAIQGGMKMASTAAVGAAAVAGVGALAGKAGKSALSGATAGAGPAGRNIGSMFASGPGQLGVTPSSGGKNGGHLGGALNGGRPPLAGNSGGSGQAGGSAPAMSLASDSGASSPSSEAPATSSASASSPSSGAPAAGSASASSPSSGAPAVGSASASSPSSRAPAAGSASASSPSSGAPAAGDASSAGIAGSPTPGESSGGNSVNSSGSQDQSRGPSRWQRFSTAAGRAADAHAQDQHQVAVQINTRGE